MARQPVSQDAQANVMVKSRRRCCICFGLNRDTSLKQGQIAHLDGDSANNSEDNLAFVCFNHHDQYDSTTRQSKNFTIAEAKKYRSELHAAIEIAFGAEVRFGEARGVVDNVSGHYIREGEHDSADLKVRLMSDDHYHISGLALWGEGRKFGPNLGELDFIAKMIDGQINHILDNPNRNPYRIVLDFSDGYIRVTEEPSPGFFGMNVSFAGKYKKAA